MRRPLFIAALLLLLTLPLLAQRRGVSSAPGFHGSASHSPRFSGTVSAPARRVIIGGGFAFGHNPHFGVFFNTRPFYHRRYFRTYYPYPYIYPYAAYPYTIYPYYGVGLQSDLIYSNIAQPSYVNSAPAYMADHDTGLQNEVYELRAELDQLRAQQAAQAERQQYALNTPTETPRPIPSARPQPQAPPTVLVFRDGRREDVANYAVAGKTLWVFSEQRARKIPLADLDLQATRTANEERGVEFAVHPPNF